MSPFAYLVSLPVRAYRLLFSPWVGFNCRYQPTCSAYALEALEKHGAIKGTWMAARRIGGAIPGAAMALIRSLNATILEKAAAPLSWG